MFLRAFRSPVLRTAVFVMLAAIGSSEAHVVPNMTVEADFAADGTYTLRINVDPRTFLAPDPTTLPPVPGSWYREQTPEQIAATQGKARDYLSTALGLIFSGQKTPLPAGEIQAIDGEDKTPLNPDTQEVHLLATVKGSTPTGADNFQIDFSKDANTSLILLHSQAGSTEVRPQVIFPGETSRPFSIRALEKKPVAEPPPPPPATSESDSVWVAIVSGIAVILVIQGWRLLNRHRHYHRGHRKPKQHEDVNN
jgi:hypothetical protein